MEPSLKNLTEDFGRVESQPNHFLQSLGKPHVDSFNEFLHRGLNELVDSLSPVEFQLNDNTRILLKVASLRLERPMIGSGTRIVANAIYPTECRQRKITYAGALIAKVEWKVNGVPQNTIEKHLGCIPVMLRSDACNLAGMSPKELVAHNEHEEEWGGCFLINGNERLIRMLLATRRNYPVAVKRRTWKQRGDMFSEYGVLIRCVADDHTSMNNVLHLVNDGSAKLMLGFRKGLYFLPLCLVLKCLLNVADEYIFQRLTEGMKENTHYASCVMHMLKIVQKEGLLTHQMVRKYVGEMFRVRFAEMLPGSNDDEICDALFRESLLIHLKTNEEKFDLLVMMTQKLFSLKGETCCDEGVDAVMFQEVLTGGQIYQLVLKEKLGAWLRGCKFQALKSSQTSKGFAGTPAEMARLLEKSGNLERGMENFLATGNANVTTLGIMQDTGLTIVPENINRMRYMSHFKAIHRGSFFVEMKTTEARQLLPDAWGFICPVHTPDGTPCGLLNHLTKNCEVTKSVPKSTSAEIPGLLYSLGMSLDYKLNGPKDASYVLLDGRVIGKLEKSKAEDVVRKLRALKVAGDQIPRTLEIAWVPKKDVKAQYPGLFLFTGPSRLMRPVTNLSCKKREMIGTFEQVYMDICVRANEAYSKVTTHMELSTTDFLSNLACLIPMPDCNQSPRNMYQCQMGKQSMGTPSHILNTTSESKLYRLLTPSSPLFRPQHYDNIELDDFAMGVNAVVAVISYTGYDMEDAIIINKSSYERGFAHGTIHKVEFIDLETPGSYFERDPCKPELNAFLDTDGLPFVGAILEEDTPIACYYDTAESRYIVKKFHGKERSYVDNVRQCVGSKSESKRACINIRLPRNPSVGDKFASRAGQKGILSQLWPAEDLPFTDSGIVPDILFNPHGFPSRMTIAMMIEVMAGKSAAVHGKVFDATPFRFDEDSPAIDYFAKMLIAAGYNQHGTERMYSGVDGREMRASIFCGVVYYQRLRHMVLDKWQVRSTGVVDSRTMQPVKGRSRGGGVRFGEMERDALIAHGASFLLNDRLFECSDRYTALVCRTCNSLLAPSMARDPKSGAKTPRCRNCKEKAAVESIEVPYMLRFLLIQLAAVNINLKVLTSTS